MARELDNAAPTIFAPTSTERRDTKLWANADTEDEASGDSEDVEEIDAYEVFGKYPVLHKSGE